MRTLEILWGDCMQRLTDYALTYKCWIGMWPIYALYLDDAKF